MNYRHPWQLKKSKSWEPIYLKNGPNWPNWPNRLCSLAGISKRAPRNLIFSIAMNADNSFYVKFIATYAPTFFGFIISVLAMVSVVAQGKCTH